MSSFSFEITDAPWFSKLVRVVQGDSRIEMLLDTLQKLEEEDLRTIHIHVHESCLHYLLPQLIKHNYVFRAYDNEFYQYYKWLLKDVEDKVHPYATSTMGATTMILSPDEQSVLFVHEKIWKPVTGSTSFNELSLDTAIREAHEEVGVELDLGFEPKLIGLWNIGGRCGKKLNDTMYCYLVKANSLDLHLDEFEVNVAKWYKIDDLREVIEMAKNKENREGNYVFWSYIIDDKGEKFGYPYLLWLDNYLKGRWLNNHVEDNTNFIY